MYFSFRVVLEEEAGVATAWVEEMGVDTDFVVVVAVVITACGGKVDTDETTMEGTTGVLVGAAGVLVAAAGALVGTAGVLVGAGLDGPVEDWGLHVDMLRLVSAWEVGDVERTELVTVCLVFEVEVGSGWSQPVW